MRTILIFLVPPVVGAIIGFITNVVAIRMLFRPHREIRIFGIRLPFTPGILPKQRCKLAQSIGGMVERELLTAEIIRQRLVRDDVREKIRQSLLLFTENILARTPGDLLKDHGEMLSCKVYETSEKVYPAFTDIIVNFLRQDEIRRELESKGRILLRNAILKLNVFQRFFLSAGQYDLTLDEKMPEIIEELIENSGNLLHDANVKNKLIGAVTAEFNSMIKGQNISLGVLLDIGENKKAELDDFLFNKLMAGVDEKIESFLETINVKNLVSDRIDSLDMLRVERIILDVMADQLKWINVFGGILGFLIGSVQVAINWFIR